MSTAGLGYSIFDANATFDTYAGAGKILAAKTDDTAGKVEADAATDVVSVWADQVDDFFLELNDWLTGNATATGPIKVTGDGIFGDQLVVGGTATGNFTGTNAVEIIGNTGRVVVADNTTDATIKAIRLLVGHHTNAEEPTAVILADSDATTANLSIGGGSSAFNCATQINFVTAANSTTTTGTTQGSVTSAGLWTLGAGAGTQTHVVNGHLDISLDAYVRDQLTVGASTQAFTGNALNISGTNGHTVGYDVSTDATDKHHRIGVGHYTTGNGVAAIITGDTSTGNNTVRVGGGYATWNAATLLEFYTAANTTTATGTLRGSVTSAGLLDWAGSITLNSASPTLTVGTTSPVLVIGAQLGSPIQQFRKSAAGTSEVTFSTGATPQTDDKRMIHGATELMQFQHYNGASWDVVMTVGADTWGVFGSAAAQPAAYTRNATVVEDRTLLASASATTLNNNNVLAALIADLQSLGIIA